MSAYGRSGARILLPRLTAEELKSVAAFLNELSMTKTRKVPARGKSPFLFSPLRKKQLEDEILKLYSRMPKPSQRLRDARRRLHALELKTAQRDSKAVKVEKESVRSEIAEAGEEVHKIELGIKATESAIRVGTLMNCEQWATKYLSDSKQLVIWEPKSWGDPLESSEGKERKRAAVEVRAAGGSVQAPTGWAEARLRNRWDDARKAFESVLIENRKDAGFYCPLPFVELPAKRPKFFIRNPDDLATWLLARMMASKQWHAIVNCELCRRFGAHQRARKKMKLCTDCRIDANRDASRRRYANSGESLPMNNRRRLKQLDKLGPLTSPQRIERHKLLLARPKGSTAPAAT